MLNKIILNCSYPHYIFQSLPISMMMLNNSKTVGSNFDLETIDTSIFSNKSYNYQFTVQKCDSNLKK